MTDSAAVDQRSPTHQDQPDTPGLLVTSAQATVHCLIGCMIGETAGLLIGVSLGLGVWPTLALAVALAFVSGLGLAAIPVMQRTDFSLGQALRTIWLGEVASIATMELAMNATDYAVGGVQAGSIFSGLFWLGLLVAVPAGFLAAWPVNYVLLKRELKHCH